jgi:hypothetical protein
MAMGLDFARVGARRAIGLGVAGLIAAACGSGGTGNVAPDGGTGGGTGGGSCFAAQSCSTFHECPGISCLCPGAKFTATIRSCRSGCCAINCEQACGSGAGGSGGTSGSGGVAGAGGSSGGAGGSSGASGGAGGSAGGSGGSAGGSGGSAGGSGGAGGSAGGSGGTGGFEDGGTPGSSAVHALFFDAGIPSGSYYGILRHAVKPQGATSFTVEDVDVGFNTSQFSTYALVEMVLDSNGYPNVAYSHFRTHELRFRRWNGSAWVKMDGSSGYDVIDTDVDYTGIAKHFIVMHQGKPEIAFRQYTNLRRYSWTGTAWQSTLVLDLYPPSGGSNPGGAPALAFDSSGYAHIAHHDHAQYHLNYVRQTGSGWQNELVSVSPQQAGQYKLLAIDSADRPHIVFKFGYTRYNGSAWVKADGSGGYDAYDTGFISAGQSPSNELVIGHRVGAGIELVRKTLAASSFSNEGAVHPGPFSGAAFTADASGTVHAVVSEGSTDANVLVYLKQTGTGWSSEPIYTHGGLCRLVHPSIAVD